ncbi:MAG: CvpA family protein [Planctomycetaceae bacterium]
MWYDLIVVAVLIFAAYRGAMKGFVWQLATIAALVLCFLFAESASLVLAPYIPAEPPLNRWVAMFLLYLLFSFLCFSLAKGLQGWIEKAKFTEYDRHLGGVFGLVKGMAFALVMTFFVVTLSEKTRGHILHTYSGTAAAIVMDRLHPVMPDELHDVLEPYIHQLDRPDLPLKHRHGPQDHADGHDHDADHDADHDRSLRGGPVVRSPASGRREPADSSDSDQRADARRSPDQPAGDRRELLHGIAEIYSDFPQAQEAFIEEIEATLTGLPDRVAETALRDWHADVYATGEDPHPGTSFSTPWDERLRRTMETLGVERGTLSERFEEGSGPFER